MKFKRAKDKWYGFTHESENGLISLGFYRVIFGIRLRVWYSDDPTSYTDWCLGDSREFIERMFNLQISILESREESRNSLSDLPPSSDLKPAWKDINFLNIVMSLNEKELEIKFPITIEDIDSVSYFQGLSDLNIRENHV